MIVFSKNNTPDIILSSVILKDISETYKKDIMFRTYSSDKDLYESKNYLFETKFFWIFDFEFSSLYIDCIINLAKEFKNIKFILFYKDENISHSRTLKIMENSNNIRLNKYTCLSKEVLKYLLNKNIKISNSKILKLSIKDICTNENNSLNYLLQKYNSCTIIYGHKKNILKNSLKEEAKIIEKKTKKRVQKLIQEEKIQCDGNIVFYLEPENEMFQNFFKDKFIIKCYLSGILKVKIPKEYNIDDIFKKLSLEKFFSSEISSYNKDEELNEIQYTFNKYNKDEVVPASEYIYKTIKEW